MQVKSFETDAKIIVIGAGPVGMLAALLAAQKKISVIVLEKRTERANESRAIGVTPPSIEILEGVGCDREFVERGVCVRRSEAHSKTRCLGRIAFTDMRISYPFILSIPQSDTEAILEAKMRSQAGITLNTGWCVAGISEEKGSVHVTGVRSDGSRFALASDYAIACDGARSVVRDALGIGFTGRMYTDTFLMGDFDDTTGWGSDARLYFTPRGSIESFPMAAGRRRYVLKTPRFIKEYTSDFLVSEIPERSGIEVRGATQHWESAFSTGRFIAQRFGKGSVFLCGDSSHTMSPIGGQNMNTGFADAELAVWLIDLLVAEKTNSEKALALYDRVRRSAARAAGFRAWLMMRLGTSGGRIWSAIRNLVVMLLLHTPLANILLPVFTMYSIPFRNLAANIAAYEKELGI